MHLYMKETVQITVLISHPPPLMLDMTPQHDPPAPPPAFIFHQGGAVGVANTVSAVGMSIIYIHIHMHLYMKKWLGLSP